MSRIAKADVHAAMQRVAQHLVDAGGADGRISRSDVEQKLDSLQGTERDLADIFFRFIDHRDFGVGNTVTKADVDKALDYAKEKMIDKYDLNNNGLSRSEISDMSRTGQLAVELSRELKIAESDVPTGADLAQKFEAVADGLYHMSEGDAPYMAFSVKPEEGQSMIDAIHSSIDFAELTDRNGGFEVNQIELYDAGESVGEYFNYYINEDGAGSDAEVAQFKAFQEVLTSNLTDLKIIHMSEDVVDGDMYIVGNAPDGSIAGVKTGRIWT